MPWRELIPRRGCLDGCQEWDRLGIVRIESPGRDVEVVEMLIAAGAEVEGQPAPDPGRHKSELVAPRQQYLGFQSVLAGLASSFEVRPHLQRTACPRAIMELFDKRATARRLVAAGIPCPPLLPSPSSAKELIAEQRAARISPVYVKLNTGSSAVGIAVVFLIPGLHALTTMLHRDGTFYSTRRLQAVTGESLLATLQFLLDQGAIVQPAIELPQIDGLYFDVRVVVQHGQPTFSIFRLNRIPLTNLHLGGQRGDPDRCRSAIPRRAWLDAIDHCVEAARLYPCDSVGIDLLFERGYYRHYLLELNAFGDFFPGLTDDQGRTVHRVEIEGTARRYGLG